MGYQEYAVKIPKNKTPEVVYEDLKNATEKEGDCHVLDIMSKLSVTLINQRLFEGDEFLIVTGERSNGKAAILSAGYSFYPIDDIVLGAGFSPRDYHKLFDETELAIVENLKKNFRLVAKNIEWEMDEEDDELDEGLPTEMEIPYDVFDGEYEPGASADYDEAISDYLSDETGYCHNGYALHIEGDVENLKEMRDAMEKRGETGELFRLVNNAVLYIQEAIENDWLDEPEEREER